MSRRSPDAMEQRVRNIEHARTLVLAERADFRHGRIVSRTLIQNPHHSVTLFALDKGEEEISSHDSATPWSPCRRAWGASSS